MKFKGRWLPETVKDYRATCLRLSNDLSNFKQDDIYKYYVGTDIRNFNYAQQIYDYIKKHYPDLLLPHLLAYFQQNDKIGNPIIHEIVPDFNFAAGTLRYIKVLGDVLKHFKQTDVRQKIIEIGGGYGGQALIFKHYKNYLYTIIDIPEAIVLAKAYLAANNFDVGFHDSEHIPADHKYDICISDFCLSELDEEGIDFYIDNVIKNCLFAYITTNCSQDKLDLIVHKLKPSFSKIIIENYIPQEQNRFNKIIIAKNGLLS